VSTFWLIFGFAGQTLFFMRFVVQWIASERQKKSVIPLAFWYFSIGGGLTLLTYAIYRQDPVFIAGQSIGLFVYLRNLRLIAHDKKASATNEAPKPTARPMRTSAPIVAALIVIVGGGWVWENELKDQVIIRNFGVVEPEAIYRSGRQTPRTMRKLHDRCQIRTIVDLGAFARGSAKDEESQRLADELHINRHRFDLRGDATGNPNDYVAALRLMADRSNWPVLVQCGAGAQRTGLAVLLYRRLVEGWTIDDAYPETFDYRNDPKTDWIMLTYLAEHFAEIKTAFESGGWIPGYPLPREDQTQTETPPAPAEPQAVSGDSV